MITLYEMKHDGITSNIANTRRAWAEGDVTAGNYVFIETLVVTAEVLLADSNAKRIFMIVKFDRASVIGIKEDGRLECIGIPLEDPDPKYRNLKRKREFRFYLLLSPGCNGMIRENAVQPNCYH